MVVVNVAHNPDLTAEQAMEIFRDGFRNRFEVMKPKYIGKFVRFDVKKDDWVRASVRLQQKANDTSFIVKNQFSATTGWYIVIIGFPPLAVFLWLSKRSALNELEAELIDFIRSCPQFN